MPSTFDGRMAELDRQVGRGRIESRVKVDQPYAKYQHERMDLSHPSGGKAHYLRDPLFLSRNGFMQRIATRALRPNGVMSAMISIADDIAHDAYKQAPFEFGDLKASPSPAVYERGTRVYYRPPQKSRLTKPELRIKYHLRSIGFGNDNHTSISRRRRRPRR